MKATEQYFPVVLCIMLYNVVLTFESVDEILKCDHLNESYWAVLSFDQFLWCDYSNESYWVALSLFSSFKVRVVSVNFKRIKTGVRKSNPVETENKITSSAINVVAGSQRRRDKMLNYVHKLISVAFHTRNWQKSCGQQAPEDMKEMSTDFFNFWHGPARENPSASLRKSALKRVKLPSLKAIRLKRPNK